MPLVCGVSSSTRATSVELRDADTGSLVATGRAAHPPARPPVSEQHPQAWWDALLAALAEATGGRGIREAGIAALSVAAQRQALVALDDRDAVIRPAKLSDDVTSARHAAALVERIGAAAWSRAVGSVPDASSTVSKLAWLRDEEPASFARLDRVMLPHDWLTFQLSGAVVTDRGDASGTGYWSPQQGRWLPEVLELVDPDVDWSARLPLVLGPLDAAGRRDGALVGPGTGETMAQALGLDLGTGDVAVSRDTGWTLCAVTERPVSDPTGGVSGLADATGRFLAVVRAPDDVPGFRDAIQRLTDAGVVAARLVAVDGGAAPDVSRVAEGSGLPVVVPALADAAATGACVQAAAVLTREAPAEVAAAWRTATGAEREAGPGAADLRSPRR